MPVGCGCSSWRWLWVLPGRCTALPVSPAVSSTAATQPPPGSEGAAGPPALMPNSQAAPPPRVTAPQVSSHCPAAPYGTHSYAPGSGKTVALTFDDGPGASTARILSILRSDTESAATFFNIGQNMAARPALVRREAGLGYVLGDHTWDHAALTKLSASAQATEMDRTAAAASKPGERLAVRVPAAWRLVQLDDLEPGPAAPDDGLAVVGGYRGLEGARIVLLVLGEPDHQPGRAGGRRIAASGRAHVATSRRATRRPSSPCRRSSGTSGATVTPS